MGLLSTIGSLAGSYFGGPLGGSIGGTIGGALDGSNGNKTTNATSISTPYADPRIAGILFGQNGSPGLLSQYQDYLGKAQDPRLAGFGNANSDLLGAYGSPATTNQLGAENSLIQGNGAPTAGPGAWAVGNMVNAPSQNNLNLSPAYSDMIYGAPGANPYLTGAIQKGIDQSNNAFANMQTNATTNLTRNILPSIRSDAVLSGQYGGSRQGIAEGNAIGDYGRAQQQAISQFGQNNTDSALATQAGAYNDDRNRALAAMSGLGAQQYGVAQQDAATKNAAEFGNVNAVNDFAKLNQNSQLQTNALNQAGKVAGINAYGNTLGNMYGYGTNTDRYGINNAMQVNGLLSPYLQNGGQSNTTPYFSNGTAQNFALGGLLGNAFKQWGVGSNGGSNSSSMPIWSDNSQPSNPFDFSNGYGTSLIG